MIFVGIDPGKEGGIALLDSTGAIIRTDLMPVVGSDIDIREVRYMLPTHDDLHVTLELQRVMALQGGKLTTGKNWGRLLALCELEGIPHQIITPAQWSQHFKIKSKLPKAEKKQHSFAAARRIWGDAFNDLKIGVSKDGMVDALLIARYAKDKA